MKFISKLHRSEHGLKKNNNITYYTLFLYSVFFFKNHEILIDMYMALTTRYYKRKGVFN